MDHADYFESVFFKKDLETHAVVVNNKYKKSMRGVCYIRRWVSHENYFLFPMDYKSIDRIRKLHMAINENGFWEVSLPDYYNGLLTLIPNDLYNFFKRNSFNAVMEYVCALNAQNIVDYTNSHNRSYIDIHISVRDKVIEYVEKFEQGAHFSDTWDWENRLAKMCPSRNYACDMNFISYGLSDTDEGIIKEQDKKKIDIEDCDPFDRGEGDRYAYEYFTAHKEDKNIWQCSETDSTIQKGIVYFISDGENTKIGYTLNDVEARLLSCQTGNPKDLHVALKIEGDRSLEKLIHRDYANKRTRSKGEWFALNDDDFEDIKYRYVKDN